MSNLEKSKATLAKVTGEIDRLLSEVILLQQDYVARTCPVCDAPCCSRVWLIFDEKDIIFARVFLKREITRRGLIRKRGCPFLSPTGCRLEPKSRPFACHRYLCPSLKEKMAQQEPGLIKGLNQRFCTLEDLRGRLWKEYLVALPEADGHKHPKPTKISTGRQK